MRTQNTTHMSGDEFVKALFAAPPGGSFIYATGYLARDRNCDKKDALDRIAELAMAANAGRTAFLTQRKIGDGIYEYIATKSAVR